MASNDEIMDMLFKITEGQTEVKSELKGVNNRLDKIELIQEEIKTKVETLGEIHQSYTEEQERLVKNSDNKILEKIDIVETATKSISSDVKEVKESINVLKEMTGRHEVDIKILQRRPV